MKKEGHKRLFSEFPGITTSMWQEKIQSDLKGTDYQTLIWHSDEGIAVKPFYRQEDIDSLEYLEDVKSLRDRSESPNGWIICQNISVVKNLKKANARIKSAIQGGVQAIRIQFARSQHPDLQMLEELFKDVSLKDTQFHFSGSLAADALYSALDQLASRQGITLSELQGSLGADPLWKMAETGIPIASLENLVKLVSKVSQFSSQLKPIEVNGSLIQNAGGNLVEELAFSMAMASEYMATLTENGIDPLTAQQALLLTLASGPKYFMEIAKLRAARIIWAKIAEAYGVNPSKAGIQIQSVSAKWNMTLYDPNVNMLRGTTEAMSSILGGADMVNVLPFDYPNGKGRVFSNRIARNVQFILRKKPILTGWPILPRGRILLKA
jgi:methylmalonyl-CoA mutase